MKKKKILIVLLLLAVVAAGCIGGYIYLKQDDNNTEKVSKQEEETPAGETKKLSEYTIDEGLSNFDLAFLKLENNEKNMIYSPLSLKYALSMLEAGAEGDAKKQISNILSDYVVKNYPSNSNMAFGNGLFIRDTFEVKDDYKELLNNRFNADVITDTFENATTFNSWISDKTLGLIDNLIDDDSIKGYDFILANALGIDMEWSHKFLAMGESKGPEDENIKHGCDYQHIKHSAWLKPDVVEKSTFDDKYEISGMNIYATLNNYDILKEVGEDKIRETVTEEFKKWAKSTEGQNDETINGDYSDSNLEKIAKQYLDGSGSEYPLAGDGYLKELTSSYQDVSYSTDFSLYVDDNVKVFAKDLLESDGTTLEYIALMPTNKSLKQYIEDTSAEEVKKIIENLKELKLENFKEGAITEITGFIPKFKFEYDLDLKNDLNKMGISDVFESGKANLTNICDNEDAVISSAEHKANIEFTQDGIKAAAATFIGGLGAGMWFDYEFEVPIEKIDLTFDKPYMFLIRDKSNGEVWFAGDVYEPLSWSEDNTIDIGF